MKGRSLAIVVTWLKVAIVVLVLAWTVANLVMDPVIDGEIQTEPRLRDLH